MAPVAKEIHWWTRKSRTTYDKEKRSFLWYISKFRPITLTMTGLQRQKLITYDGSQSMMWDSSFYVNEQDYCAMPAVVNLILPNIKIIVVMRNPATRLYSDFIFTWTHIYTRNIKHWPYKLRQDSVKIFHNVIEQHIELFNNCTRTASVFECANLRLFNIGHEDIGDCRIRLSIGIYVVHIKKWLQFYPIRNFLFLRTEDLSKHSKDITLNVTNFLGIERGSEVISESFETHKNAHPSGIQPVDSSTLSLLENFYRPYNEQLAHLLNDNSFLWKD